MRYTFKLRFMHRITFVSWLRVSSCLQVSTGYISLSSTPWLLYQRVFKRGHHLQDWTHHTILTVGFLWILSLMGKKSHRSGDLEDICKVDVAAFFKNILYQNLAGMSKTLPSPMRRRIPPPLMHGRLAQPSVHGSGPSAYLHP